jgi:hypothetical protein
MRAFDGCAVLTDDDRVRGASRVAAFLMPCPLRLLALGERLEAVAWLTSPPAAAAIKPRLVEPGVAVVEVSEPLRTEDFVLLAPVVDGWLADHPTLPGLVCTPVGSPAGRRQEAWCATSASCSDTTAGSSGWRRPATLAWPPYCRSSQGGCSTRRRAPWATAGSTTPCAGRRTERSLTSHSPWPAQQPRHDDDLAPVAAR